MDALDYLLKPISYTEFLRAAMKAQEWFLRTSAGGPEAENVKRDSIWVRADYRQVRVRLEDILYIEGVKDYVRICLADGSHVMTQMSLKAMGEQLPADEFARVHRSYIVHMPEVKTIERGRIVFGKVRIPISDSFRDEFMQRLAQRAFIAPRAGAADSEASREKN